MLGNAPAFATATAPNPQPPTPHFCHTPGAIAGFYSARKKRSIQFGAGRGGRQLISVARAL